MIQIIAEALAAAGEAASGASAAASSFASVSASAKKTGDALNSVAGQLQNVEGKASRFVSSLAGMSAEVTGLIAVGANALKSFADPLTELSALANPAGVIQFNYAFKDALAVIGRAVTPIVQALTGAMRGMGDTFAQFEPILASVSTNVAEFIRDLTGDFKQMVNENSEAIEFLISSFNAVATILWSVGKGAISVAGDFLYLVKSIANGLGFHGGGQDKKGASSFGAAVRDVHTTTSGESIAQNAVEKALAQALNTGPDKKDTPSLLEEIKIVLLDWKNVAESAWMEIKSLIPNLSSLPNLGIGESFDIAGAIRAARL